MKRFSIVSGGLAILVLGLLAPAASANFKTASSVDSIDATCLTSGKLKNRVVVDVGVKYSFAKAGYAAKHPNARHRVKSQIKVFRKGRLIARDRDRGTAQVAAGGSDSYLHVHRHVLTRKASRKALHGRKCARAGSPVVRVKATGNQTLSALVGPKAARTAAASTGQGDSSSSKVEVDPTASVPDVINGCVLTTSQPNCYKADLHGEDLSNRYLAFSDFSYADLSGADLSGSRLGQSVFYQTNLDGANMTGTLIGNTLLTGSSLVGTNLTNAKLQLSSLVSADFTKSNLSGANLSHTNLFQTTFSNSACNGQTLLVNYFGYGCHGGFITK